MKKLVISTLSIVLLGASSIAHSDAHGDLNAEIAKLKEQKSYLAYRLANAIAYSNERKMQIDMLQKKADSEGNKRKVLSTRLRNAIAFSNEREMQIDMLQKKADSEGSKRKVLGSRLRNAIAYSNEREMQMDMLQKKADSEGSKGKVLSTRLRNAIAFSNEREMQIEMLQKKVDSEQSSRKVSDSILGSAIALSKKQSVQIDMLQKKADSEESKRKTLSFRLRNAIAFSNEREKQIESLQQQANAPSNWAAATGASLDSAFGGVQGTTVDVNADHTVNILVGNNGLFNSSSTVLSASGTELMSLISQELLTTNANLTIVGHTDNVPVGEGSRFSSNEELSFERAVSTMQFLRDQGLPTARLSAAGYGETNPIASNSTAEGRQQNRRVEIVVRQR